MSHGEVYTANRSACQRCCSRMFISQKTFSSSLQKLYIIQSTTTSSGGCMRKRTRVIIVLSYAVLITIAFILLLAFRQKEVVFKEKLICFDFTAVDDLAECYQKLGIRKGQKTVLVNLTAVENRFGQVEPLPITSSVFPNQNLPQKKDVVAMVNVTLRPTNER